MASSTPSVTVSETESSNVDTDLVEQAEETTVSDKTLEASDLTGDTPVIFCDLCEFKTETDSATHNLKKGFKATISL